MRRKIFGKKYDAVYQAKPTEVMHDVYGKRQRNYLHLQ